MKATPMSVYYFMAKAYTLQQKPWTFHFLKSLPALTGIFQLSSRISLSQIFEHHLNGLMLGAGKSLTRIHLSWIATTRARQHHSCLTRGNIGNSYLKVYVYMGQIHQFIFHQPWFSPEITGTSLPTRLTFLYYIASLHDIYHKTIRPIDSGQIISIIL